jgi:hypothetical protein
MDDFLSWRQRGQTVVVEKHTTDLVADPSVKDAIEQITQVMTAAVDKVNANTLAIAQILERLASLESRVIAVAYQLEHHDHDIEADFIDGRIVFKKRAA